AHRHGVRHYRQDDEYHDVRDDAYGGDDLVRHGDEAELERRLGLGERLGEGVPEGRVHGARNGRGIVRIRHAEYVETDLVRSAPPRLAHRLVQVVPVKHEVQRDLRVVDCLEDTAHHELPGAGVNRAPQRQHVAYLEAVALGELPAHHAALAIA